MLKIIRTPPIIAGALLLSMLLATRAQTSNPPAAKSDRSATPSAGSATLLDINTASIAQLEALPGIGGVYALRIIGGRPYDEKSQLVLHGIVPVATYERVKHRIIAKQPKSSR